MTQKAVGIILVNSKPALNIDETDPENETYVMLLGVLFMDDQERDILRKTILELVKKGHVH
jgi:hypothetical protein